ncbi:carboxypeptidase M32 [Thiovibrio frasassiensis]|uniref:Metal-dependent carboxypeptidase n=1 Tax=Thiovibrio frasassiensis TaxID=2984131 RepID=A0A9X4MKR6_9BACT|nr:carboxypeptidase M32 [Thiovibrio frasassiensis]MDG4474632.1 carboxypeptidase M32 [Thiovibrio frasassiensis]
MKPLAQLRKYSAELVDLHHALALMQWDQEVRMPRLAGEDRASQFATLSALVHRREVAPELGGLLAEVEAQKGNLSVEECALLRVMRRSYEQNTRLPEEFVAEFSRLTSQAQMRWLEAREQSDFTIFQPLLERLVALSRQQAEYLGYAVHPYDALLDLYEEGLTTAQVTRMFGELQAPLVAMVKKFAGRLTPLSFNEPFSLAGQEQFAEHLLVAMGFDFSRGCLARSAHPFTTTLGHHDRRITNRYAPESLDFIFGALHEGGHALYEQGIDERLAHTHLDDGVSLGIHESQSRFWENVVGRGNPFWQRFFPELQQAFPAQFSLLGLTEFVRGINAVTPGLIRVDADEVTYNLHVLIRFEIEKGLIEGSVQVADLPGIWREKYRDYLGVEVPSDAEGVLQDIHWSHGSFGYFPTYTIGNLAAAQIWEAYKQYDPGFQQTLADGNLSKVREWLVREIHGHGSVYLPEALLVRVTGAPLSAQPFLAYLEEKFSTLIG